MSLAVVQTCYKKTIFVNHDVTFSSPVTAGNLLILFINNLATAQLSADWQPLDDTGNFLIAGRIALSGDGTTPPPYWVETSNIASAICVEVSGFTGTITSAFEGLTTSTAPNFNGPATANNNDLAFCAWVQGSGFGTYTPGSGWTNLHYSGNESMGVDYQIVPTAGTVPIDNSNNSVGGNAGKWSLPIFGLGSGGGGGGGSGKNRLVTASMGF